MMEIMMPEINADSSTIALKVDCRVGDQSRACIESIVNVRLMTMNTNRETRKSKAFA